MGTLCGLTFIAGASLMVDTRPASSRQRTSSCWSAASASPMLAHTSFHALRKGGLD